MSDQGKEYAGFIRDQLHSEDERRTNVYSRAATALTGATGLATLVLAVFAVFLGKDFTLTGCAKSWMVVALIALLAAGAFAVVAGYPAKYYTPTDPTLESMTNERWENDEVDARNVATYINTKVLLSLRSGTERKMRWLFAAGICQLVAVGALAGSSLAVLGICVWPMNHFADSSNTTTTSNTTTPPTTPVPPPVPPPPISIVVNVTCPCTHDGMGAPKKDP